MLNMLRNNYKKEIDVYYGDLLVLTINKELFTPHNGGQKLEFNKIAHKTGVINLNNIPYLDNDTPTILITDKENQMVEIIYISYGVNSGMGSLYRTARELPALMKFKDGSIIEEEYLSNQYNLKIRHDYSFYTIPSKMVYQQGIINDEESNWIRWSPDVGFFTISHADYRKMIIEELNINIDNFKNFTQYEKMAITMYMVPENYAMKLKEFDIEPTKEGIKNNLKLLEMIYI